MVTRKLTYFWLPVFLLLTFGIAQSEEYQQSPSLSGLTTAKVYFDVNIGIPEKLVVRLILIDKTLSQLQAAGVKPEAIIAFRGKASKFVTKGDFYVEKEEQAAKAEVHKWLKKFAGKGIAMEQCLIAAELNGISPNDFRPELKIIQNGYISMIAYQNRGFALIPMD
ncbi:MAG: DsrE family protein [Proteobacteria bacterium]|nr:DsrE family protein [Pseudomonadota bacterium]MBU1233857.1 DsrE family protein [Pseudomonadota bacterium]MBU1418949.1 DsrE family protein [Pseudomonadota bacterium]MBU1453588.1 DsrE family protein [Pseudomonadota bacterium]